MFSLNVEKKTRENCYEIQHEKMRHYTLSLIRFFLLFCRSSFYIEMVLWGWRQKKNATNMRSNRNKMKLSVCSTINEFAFTIFGSVDFSIMFYQHAIAHFFAAIFFAFKRTFFHWIGRKKVSKFYWVCSENHSSNDILFNFIFYWIRNMKFEQSFGTVFFLFRIKCERKSKKWIFCWRNGQRHTHTCKGNETVYTCFVTFS